MKYFLILYFYIFFFNSQLISKQFFSCFEHNCHFFVLVGNLPTGTEHLFEIFVLEKESIENIFTFACQNDFFFSGKQKSTFCLHLYASCYWPYCLLANKSHYSSWYELYGKRDNKLIFLQISQDCGKLLVYLQFSIRLTVRRYSGKTLLHWQTNKVSFSILKLSSWFDVLLALSTHWNFTLQSLCALCYASNTCLGIFSFISFNFSPSCIIPKESDWQSSLIFQKFASFSTNQLNCQIKQTNLQTKFHQTNPALLHSTFINWSIFFKYFL